MKSLIILLFAGLLSFNASARDTKPVSNEVMTAFNKTFTQAKCVAWTATGSEIYKAEFQFNGQQVTAFYHNSGTLIALTRNILSTQLPLLLEASLKENYASYWITDVVEIASEEETTYYVTVEDADNKVVLKSGQFNWSVYRRVKK
jgi:hypothetical protein